MCFVCLQCKFEKRNLTGNMEDRSHGTSQYKEIIFLLMSVAMTRSDVWDRYPSTIEVTICFQMQESGLKPLS